jgi:hypothetical protein
MVSVRCIHYYLQEYCGKQDHKIRLILSLSLVGNLLFRLLILLLMLLMMPEFLILLVLQHNVESLKMPGLCGFQASLAKTEISAIKILRLINSSSVIIVCVYSLLIGVAHPGMLLARSILCLLNSISRTPKDSPQSRPPHCRWPSPPRVGSLGCRSKSASGARGGRVF